MRRRIYRAPVTWLIAGIAFFIGLGVLLYNRPPGAKPEALLWDRDLHDTLSHKMDSLKHRLDATLIQNVQFRLALNRLIAIDTLNSKHIIENRRLIDSLKTLHEEKPPSPADVSNNELSEFFTKEYSR